MNFADLRFWGYLVGALVFVVLIRLPVARLIPARLNQFDKLALLGVGIFLLFRVSWITLTIFLSSPL